MNASPEQWIELYNRSASPVDVSGWEFSEGVSYTFPAGTTIPAGGFAVVAWDPAGFAVLKAVALWIYPLSQPKVDEIETALTARRAAATA